MKIIIALHRDSVNLYIENVIRALEKRHQLRIFSKFTDAQSLHMFADLKVPIEPLDACTDEAIEWCDFIFSTLAPIEYFKDVHKYIFSFCNIVPMLETAKGADFVFLIGASQDEPVPYFASMPVGIPKNDTAITNTPGENKQFLYIDSGHYPFGKNGKEQIAKMLVDVCRAYPDCQVCVKPRWLPDATAPMMIHQNYDHIYTILNEMLPNALPQNLNLLMEHRNLQELIDESSCVLCLCTSAYLDVALRDKPLLILSGFDNESTYEFSDGLYEELYKTIEKSGCVIPYYEVLQHLPCGKKCNPQHIKDAIAYNSNASDRIVEVMAYIFENYLSVGKFPDLRQYNYEDYRDQLSSTAALTYEDLLINRLFFFTKVWGTSEKRMKTTHDTTAFETEILQMCREAVMASTPIDILKESVIEYKANYLLKRFPLLTNEMNRYQLYFLLFKCEQFEELLAIERKQLGLCGRTSLKLSNLSAHPNFLLRKLGENSLKRIRKMARVDPGLNYFLAIIYYENNMLNFSRIYLERYFEKLFSRNYPKYYEEKGRILMKAFFRMFKFLMPSLSQQKWRQRNLNMYVQKYLEYEKIWSPELRAKGDKTRLFLRRVAAGLQTAGYTDTAQKLELRLENWELFPDE